MIPSAIAAATLVDLAWLAMPGLSLAALGAVIWAVRQWPRRAGRRRPRHLPGDRP
jgi:hypothetical protein